MNTMRTFFSALASAALLLGGCASGSADDDPTAFDQELLRTTHGPDGKMTCVTKPLGGGKTRTQLIDQHGVAVASLDREPGTDLAKVDLGDSARAEHTVPARGDLAQVHALLHSIYLGTRGGKAASEKDVGGGLQPSSWGAFSCGTCDVYSAAGASMSVCGGAQCRRLFPDWVGMYSGWRQLSELYTQETCTAFCSACGYSIGFYSLWYCNHTTDCDCVSDVFAPPQSTW